MKTQICKSEKDKNAKSKKDKNAKSKKYKIQKSCFIKKNTKRQNTQLQNRFYLGGVHGEPRFPVN